MADIHIFHCRAIEFVSEKTLTLSLCKFRRRFAKWFRVLLNVDISMSAIR